MGGPGSELKGIQLGVVNHKTQFHRISNQGGKVVPTPPVHSFRGGVAEDGVGVRKGKAAQGGAAPVLQLDAQPSSGGAIEVYFEAVALEKKRWSHPFTVTGRRLDRNKTVKAIDGPADDGIVILRRSAIGRTVSPAMGSVIQGQLVAQPGEPISNVNRAGIPRMFHTKH